MQTRRREQIRKQKKTSPITTNPNIKFMTYNFFEEDGQVTAGHVEKIFMLLLNQNT